MGIKVAPLVAAGRRLTSGSFLDSATIFDRTITSDGHGGQTSSYVARLNPLMMSLVNVKDGVLKADTGTLEGSALLTVLVPYGTEFADGLRFLVEGKLYEIVGRISAKSARTIVDRYTAREVEA